MKVALYVRVSRAKGQNPDTQLRDLREYCRSRNFDVVEEFVDVGQSGSKEFRPELTRLMDAARKRKIDAVVVWRFDRFGRSIKHLINSLDEFNRLGISFISFSENIDSTSPMGKVMFAVISALSEFERNILIERVHAGLRLARSKGKTLGRPKLKINAEEIKMLKNSGSSLRSIARQIGVSKSTVSRY